jgi:hypothetical protein
MPKMIKVDSPQSVPTWAIPYIANGDRDHLKDSEVAAIDRWLEQYKNAAFSFGDSEYFDKWPAIGTDHCMCVDCDIFVPQPPSPSKGIVPLWYQVENPDSPETYFDKEF